jgi:hypothetical protein
MNTRYDELACTGSAVILLLPILGSPVCPLFCTNTLLSLCYVICVVLRV